MEKEEEDTTNRRRFPAVDEITAIYEENSQDFMMFLITAGSNFERAELFSSEKLFSFPLHNTAKMSALFMSL